MRSSSVFKPRGIASAAAALLAVACGGSGSGGGSGAPCRTQPWMQSRELASHPAITAAVGPMRGRMWLRIADESGYFNGVSFDGTATLDGVLVVFTCGGDHVLTQRFGPSTSIRTHASRYVLVRDTRGTPGLERSADTYYRFTRGQLRPVGQIVRREVVPAGSVNGTEESARVSWRSSRPDELERCVERRPGRIDRATGSWISGAVTERFTEVYRLEEDTLRLASRVDGCAR
jgi:hypothetical protein